MRTKLRVARATNDLERISSMYRIGLSLKVLGSFEDHAGFDGIILGEEDSDYHLEFTTERGSSAPLSASEESILVFYYPEESRFAEVGRNLEAAGFLRVSSHNPYWDLHGKTFEDPEGFRVVIVFKS